MGTPIKSRKAKSDALPETAALQLVEMFIRDEKVYNSRVQGGSKTGKTPRQRCIEKWREELEELGYLRSVEYIGNRIKGDIQTVKATFTLEQAERGKTGGGKPKKGPKLDLARKRLYEHFEGSHIVNGMEHGFESGHLPEEEKDISLHEEVHHDNLEPSFNSEDIGSLLTVSVEREVMEGSERIINRTAIDPPSSFEDFVKNRKRKQTKDSDDVLVLRSKLIKSEIEVSEKKKRNLDEKYRQMELKAQILENQKKASEIQLRILAAQAERTGVSAPYFEFENI